MKCTKVHGFDQMKSTYAISQLASDVIKMYWDLYAYLFIEGDH